MEQSDRRWMVSCAACEIGIGLVTGGRFVHDPACAQPLAIGRGAMRCCRCGGVLSVVEELVDVVEDVAEEPFRLHDLAAERLALRDHEARQRG
jgi:hypothetical protein